jgi:hypothetical protein
VSISSARGQGTSATSAKVRFNYFGGSGPARKAESLGFRTSRINLRREISCYVTSVRSKSVNGGYSSGTKKLQVDGAQFVGERDDGKLGNESRPSKPMSSIGSRQIICFITPGKRRLGLEIPRSGLRQAGTTYIKNEIHL